MSNAAHRPQLPAGEVIGGRFRIEYKIGEGGFGDVYRAVELSSGQPVAVKTLRNEVNPQLPDMVQRFEREFTLARKLRHPRIVAMYDFGRLRDGTLYMAMEYVAGEELEQVLRRERRLPIERARTIVLQVLEALATAHQMGVVHRDLKPSNVMLLKGVPGDVVKLLDFGVAKAFDGTYADLTAQNLAGSVGFGTPQYMAPEQIFGQNIGPCTDLYAVGLIFIELVTGRAPMMAATPADIIQRQLQEEVAIPDWLRHSPIGQVIERAVAKDWRARFQLAGELYAALSQAPLPQQGAGVAHVSEVPGDATVMDLRSQLSAHEIHTMRIDSPGGGGGASVVAAAAPTMVARQVAAPTVVTRLDAHPQQLAPHRAVVAPHPTRAGVAVGGVVIPMPLVIASMVLLALVLLLAVFLLAG